jgi:hypothetical protein
MSWMPQRGKTDSNQTTGRQRKEMSKATQIYWPTLAIWKGNRDSDSVSKSSEDGRVTAKHL